VDVRWISRDGISPVPAAQIPELITRGNGFVWAHMNHDDEFGMSVLIMTVAPRPEDLREVSSRTPVPRLHMYADHHFSAINGLVRGTDGLLHLQPLKVFLTPHVLWTLLGPTTSALSGEAVTRDLDVVRQQLDDGDIEPETTFEMIAAIRAVMIRGQEDLIATGARRVADLEGRATMGDPMTAETVLQDLSELRHDLQMIRINAAQTYELYDNLMDTMAVDPHVMPIDPRRLALLRQQYGHLKNAADLERDYLQEVLDMLQTRLSNELNRFVRKVTAYGSIAIAWTVVAGVYGMNFADMPELGWAFGYPAAIGLMLLISTVLWVLFRRHRWL
jgi:Mg2+ and Co2+ transporter CorA